MCVAAALLTVLFCGLCAAQQDRATLDSDLLTEPGFHLPRARASADAYRLYESVNQARAAIKAGDRQAANNQVHWAVAAADRLRAKTSRKPCLRRPTRTRFSSAPWSRRWTAMPRCFSTPPWR